MPTLNDAPAVIIFGTLPAVPIGASEARRSGTRRESGRCQDRDHVGDEVVDHGPRPALVVIAVRVVCVVLLK